MLTEKKKLPIFPTLFVFILFLASTWLVVDTFALKPYYEVLDLENSIISVQNETQNYSISNQIYYEVLEEYQKFTTGSSEIIAPLIDSMEALALSEKYLIRSSYVKSLAIANLNITVRFAGENLMRISEIYNNLSSDPLVLDVQFCTASTQSID